MEEFPSAALAMANNEGDNSSAPNSTSSHSPEVPLTNEVELEASEIEEEENLDVGLTDNSAQRLLGHTGRSQLHAWF